MFVGVDGCRAGWLAIGLETEGSWQVNTFPDVSSLWDHHRGASLILIDIPIGLKAEGKAERRCDPQARKLLVRDVQVCFPRRAGRRSMHRRIRKPVMSIND